MIEEGKSVYLKGESGCLPSVQHDRRRRPELRNIIDRENIFKNKDDGASEDNLGL